MESILHQVTSLRRATTKYGPAPHKPILLLAILELFEEEEIDSKWVEINEDLIIRFYDLWHLYVKHPNTPNFALTFFHMGNERRGLWKLVVAPGKSIITAHKFAYKSLSILKDTILGAQLSDEFYLVLKNRLNRDALKNAILDTYFPDITAREVLTSVKYSSLIEKQICNTITSFSEIKLHYDQEDLIESKEEEVLLRDYIFRKVVLKTYNHQCAVCRLQVESSDEEYLLDACHIIPFSQSGDNSIQNGIALAPTLHRAFEKGLIAIDNNYKIMVSKKLKDHNLPAGIKRFAHKTIHLPFDEAFYPSLERLSEHRARFGFE